MTPWEQNEQIPLWAAGLLAALHFSGGSTRQLEQLSDEEWRKLLVFCDRNQLTLTLGHVCGAALPEWVRRRIGDNLRENCRRHDRIKDAWGEIAGALEARGVEFITLKGFTQWPRFVPDLRLRPQYDLDFFSPPDHLKAAREALFELGYEAADPAERFPADHLPILIRKTGWRWKGNYFDPDIPAAVDIHFRFWDAETEGFEAPGADQFWLRRGVHRWNGRSSPALDPADALAYSTLHLLRHWLRGSLRPHNVYELAYFLDAQAEDEDFWRYWAGLHPPGLRRLEAVCFRLAADWFACRLPAAAEREVRALPADVQLWFEHYAASPMEALFRPNKDELWLHLCLVESAAARRQVAARRLLPLRLPPPEETYTPEEHVTWRFRLQRSARYAAHVLGRTAHHARALAPTLWHGRFWLRAGELETPFWIFLAAASLFNFGTFIFTLLYNLYLLDAGFGEKLLGFVGGAAAAGSIAGTFPAAWLIRRSGLERTLLICFVASATLGALRALVPSGPALVGLAFLGGAVFSTFAVSIAPAIAQLTSEETRPRGFSVFFGLSIALGAAGGLAGGNLPRLLARLFPLIDARSAKQAALLVGCAFVGLAAWPASRLRFPRTPSRIKHYPRDPFVARFLLVLAAWSLATGAFNPFFNAYFSRHLGAPVERVGELFSAGQIAQVAAILAAPLVLRRFGLARGISAMQAATGAALGCLAGSRVLAAAATSYLAYVAFQWMSEPGMYSLLMNRVKPAERSGASALNFLVAFASQAVAASLAGVALARFGYPAVIGMAAGMALVAAMLANRLLSPPAGKA